MCILEVRIDAGTSSLLQLLSTLADILNLYMPQFLHMQKGLMRSISIRCPED